MGRVTCNRIVAVALAFLCVGVLANARVAAAAPQTLEIVTKSGVHVFSVELAVTEEQLSRGLMFRKRLPEGEGMLFDFRRDQPVTMWMKNTLIPLDMIFIDDTGRIVGIVPRAEPRTLTPRDPGVPSRYVLEVNGGWAAAHGVAVGDTVRFENVMF